MASDGGGHAQEALVRRPLTYMRPEHHVRRYPDAAGRPPLSCWCAGGHGSLKGIRRLLALLLDAQDLVPSSARLGAGTAVTGGSGRAEGLPCPEPALSTIGSGVVKVRVGGPVRRLARDVR